MHYLSTRHRGCNAENHGVSRTPCGQVQCNLSWLAQRSRKRYQRTRRAYNYSVDFADGTISYEAMAQFRAAVLLPWHVHCVSFWELYALTVPLFAPTGRLLKVCAVCGGLESAASQWQWHAQWQ